MYGPDCLTLFSYIFTIVVHLNAKKSIGRFTSKLVCLKSRPTVVKRRKEKSNKHDTHSEMHLFFTFFSLIYVILNIYILAELLLIYFFIFKNPSWIKKRSTQMQDS